MEDLKVFDIVNRVLLHKNWAATAISVISTSELAVLAIACLTQVTLGNMLRFVAAVGYFNAI